MPSIHQLTTFRTNKAAEYSLRKPFTFPAILQEPNIKGVSLFILPSANKQLETLPTFEQTAIAKRIVQLAANAQAPNDGFKNKVAQQYMRILHENHFIDYVMEGGEVTVEGVTLDPTYAGIEHSKQQRAVYHVEKQFDVAVSQSMSAQDQEALKDSWAISKKTSGQVETKHAAVNGMLNALDNAVWLMGAHVQVGFAEDAPDEYSLFHNPTRGGGSDFWDCINDKLGFSTVEAKQLADILHDNQTAGKEVKWVVHSQGGIIFAEAVRYHIKNRGSSLSNNSVVFHGNGNNSWRTEKLLKKAGIKKLAPDRANDYDAVHKIAGFNGNPIQMVGSLLHIKKLAGKESDQTYSPHTLPLVGQEAWSRKHGILKSRAR